MLRRRHAGGRVGEEASVDAAQKVRAATVIHPLTLRFSDAAKERAYNTQRFQEAYSTVVWFCSACSLLNVLRAIAFPELFTGCLSAVAVCAIMLLSRVALHRLADQQLAQRVFSWVMACTVALACAAVVTGHIYRKRTSPGTEPASANAIYFLALVGFLFQLYFALIAIPFVPRLLALGVAASITPVVALLASPVSVLGQPYELLVIGSGLVLSELVAYPLERRSRRTFLTRETSLPSSPSSPLQRLSAEGEREYLVRRFTSSYDTSCRIWIVLGALSRRRRPQTRRPQSLQASPGEMRRCALRALPPAHDSARGCDEQCASTRSLTRASRPKSLSTCPSSA